MSWPFLPRRPRLARRPPCVDRYFASLTTPIASPLLALPTLPTPRSPARPEVSVPNPPSPRPSSRPRLPNQPIRAAGSPGFWIPPYMDRRRPILKKTQRKPKEPKQPGRAERVVSLNRSGSVRCSVRVRAPSGRTRRALRAAEVGSGSGGPPARRLATRVATQGSWA
jgi:hypothetical protein